MPNASTIWGASGHSTNNCPRLRHQIQNLIDHKHLVLNPIAPPNVNTNPLPNHASGSINMISVEEETPATIKQEAAERVIPMVAPVIYDFVPEIPQLVFDYVPQGPNPSRYQSDRAVPWNYGTYTEAPQQEVFSMTRSGRCYVQPESPPKEKEAEMIPKKRVTEEEASAFMKIVKEAEYKVVDQLRKTPAQISLLALLLSSEPHRNALMGILKEALVPKEISASQVENMVGSVFAGQITFGDDDLGPEEQLHGKALHIVCKSMGYVLSRVMIDNGSALNVCPLSTLQHMKVASTSGPTQPSTPACPSVK